MQSTYVIRIEVFELTMSIPMSDRFSEMFHQMLDCVAIDRIRSTMVNWQTINIDCI
jgi:hypothetical protein